jgi:chloramphenicol O-acetyltransferase
MRYVDIQSWPRRKHFERYRAFDHPHFGLCANVEVTAFFPAVKKGGHLAVQGHHALMDGIHVGKFYAAVQDDLCHPDSVFE